MNCVRRCAPLPDGRSTSMFGSRGTIILSGCHHERHVGLIRLGLQAPFQEQHDGHAAIVRPHGVQFTQARPARCRGVRLG